ncbi:CopG family transcriptional regulator [Candidatus Daviesbacteria bacterium]|nr:CopG family transcriptional regulator [Candidatus Daviesbacteria bacterium]
MNRYQIYLNPKSVDTIDNLTRLINLSRSQIIRDVIDKMANEYEKLLVKTEASRMKDNPLLKMAGFAKGPGKDISHNVNEIYLKD